MGTLYVLPGTVFIGNIASLDDASSVGALLVFDSSVAMNQTLFEGNQGYTAAAMYLYRLSRCDLTHSPCCLPSPPSLFSPSAPNAQPSIEHLVTLSLSHSSIAICPPLSSSLLPIAFCSKISLTFMDQGSRYLNNTASSSAGAVFVQSYALAHVYDSEFRCVH